MASSATETTQVVEVSPSVHCEDVSKGGTGSSAEEIEQQHATALKIVEDGICYAEVQWEGEIPLLYKTRPLNLDRGPPPSDFVPCWSIRGHADISALQALVLTGYNRKYKLDVSKEDADDKMTKSEGPTNFWDPLTAASLNVPIRRPSHDAWGIPKIVLLFCDDFCQDCYELPWWWQDYGLAAAIQPVLDVLQITASRVVRLLLASLPTGSTIPVHHDTGEWVKYTHRVHVPVLVKNVSNILFRCGPSEDNMDAIPCVPGHVFEINNQAKHAVSNCDSDYRVHLILDYVDANFRQYKRKDRIRLQPGEILLQTRRSIDRLACKGQRPTPSFMILGAQKAGTTYLFELIMQHPLLVKPKNRRRETHCLDWRWKDDLRTTAERQKWCFQFFHWRELQLHPSCLTGDSTPSYLLDSARVIPRIKQVFPWKINFFVMCRDPVKRAESHFAMVTSTEGTPAQLKARGSEWRTKSFDQVVADDFLKMIKCGLLPYWKLDYSLNDDSLVKIKDWTSVTFDQAIYKSFVGSSEEDMAWGRYLKMHVPLNTGSYGLLSRGLYELNLRPWFRAFDPDDFMVLKLEAMATIDGTASNLKQIWEHLDVPPFYELADTMPKNTRDYHSIVTTETRRFMQCFYEPHNIRLQSTLHKTQQHMHESGLWELHWAEIWDYV